MLRRAERARRRIPHGEDGAAVVDFALVSILLVFLLMAVLQVAVFFYARTVVASATADAARFAAAQGSSPEAGVARANALVAAGLDDNDAAAIHCTATSGADAASGLPVTTVRCAGDIRLLFLPIGSPLHVETSSTVLTETHP